MNQKLKMFLPAMLALSLSPMAAFAAAPDVTSITTAITDNQTAAVTVAVAFAVAVWVIRSIHLIRRG
jgi:hypothetical protein